MGVDFDGEGRCVSGRVGRRRVLLSATVCLLCVAGFVAEVWPPSAHTDDAYISYRYAENLVSGQGLVYNPGERVEGFTNLLWTLLVALGVLLGADAPTLGHVLGLASGIAVLGLTFGYAWSSLKRPELAALSVLIVLASASLSRWSASGMETPLFTAAVVGAVWSLRCGRVGAMTASLCIATLTRPEGVLVACVLYGFATLDRRDHLGRAVRAPAVWAAVLIALTVFRLAYYGSPVPNTYYAKVPGSSEVVGLVYLRNFLAEGAGPLLLLALAAWPEARLRPALILVLAFLPYTVVVGGDYLGFHRLLLPVLPILAVTATRGLERLCERGRASAGIAALVLVCSFWLSLFGATLEPSAILEFRRVKSVVDARSADAHREKAARRSVELLKARRRRVDLVAATGIGVFGYYSGYPMVDILGLVDPTISRSLIAPGRLGSRLPGHSRSNAAYVLSRDPDYILVQKRDTVGIPIPAVRDLWSQPGFDRYYAWDELVRGYRRRAALRRLGPPNPVLDADRPAP